MSSAIQALLFSKNKKYGWDSKRVKEYIKYHNYHPIKSIHETSNFYRVRLRRPDVFRRMRLFRLSPKMGIESILGFY